MRITPTVTRAGVAVALTVAAACVVTTTGADAATRTTRKVTFWAGGSDEAHTVAVLHGGITDAGKDTSPNDSYDVAKLSKGTIRINHPDSKAKFTYSIDPRTCYAVFHETGSLTFDHGTGAYRGYTGRGTYTGTGHFVLARTAKGACDKNSEGTGLFVVSGSGTVTH